MNAELAFSSKSGKGQDATLYDTAEADRYHALASRYIHICTGCAVQRVTYLKQNQVNEGKLSASPPPKRRDRTSCLKPASPVCLTCAVATALPICATVTSNLVSELSYRRARNPSHGGLTGTSGDRGGIEGELDSSPSAETRWDRVVPRLIPVHMRGPRRE